MRKTYLFVLAFVLFSASAFAQTFQWKSRVAINAGQCVAISGFVLVPCNNITASPTAVVGVALTTVPSAPAGHFNEVTVQQWGIAIVPVPDGTLCASGDYVGDIDGTGNLGDLTFPFFGPLLVGQDTGPFGNAPYGYAGICISISPQGDTMTLVVQPGIVPGTVPTAAQVSRPGRRSRP